MARNRPPPAARDPWSGHAGTWPNAVALPGFITTNGGHSEINSVSCATGNYCVAVGETSTDQ